MSTFKRVVDASGLRGTEVAVIFEVDRRTIYDWLHGITPRQSTLRRLLIVGVSALDRATKAGVLPLRKDVKGAERRKRVNEMAGILRKLAVA